MKNKYFTRLSTLRFPLPQLGLLIALAMSVACAGQNEVEGEGAQASFSIRDNAPELRISEPSGDATMVWAEEDGELLRTMIITVPGDAAITVGEPVALLSSSDVVLSLAVGELETMEANGRRVINARNPTFYEVVEGTVIFDSLSDPVSGWFTVTLADGSVVRGFFSLDGQLR